jgi:proteasome beta subunit
MTGIPDGTSGLPDALFTPGTGSFTQFLTSYAPDLLPANRLGAGGTGALEIEHSTTVMAATFADGVVVAGDRRATQGNFISKRHAEKVHQADEFSAVATSGASGIGLEMVKLFQVELEHYEKTEGHTLSLEGKANRLSSLVRGNLGAAMQGLAVIPLFAGYDVHAGVGRIFTYEVAGGVYESPEFDGIGSGSIFARGAMKKLYAPGMTEQDVVTVCLQALYDAAEDDAATSGPDVARQIYPRVAVVTAEGYRMMSDEEVTALAGPIVEDRMGRPDGPHAPLR